MDSMNPQDMMDGLGGETNDNSGDTAEDAAEARPAGQQLPGLPPMIGQDGKPLIVPIDRTPRDY